MHLDGSCHCGSVKFSVRSAEPYPFMRCYCSICRKTAGGGGFSINLGADKASLRVTGKRHVRVYVARLQEEGMAERTSTAERHFCGRCGSALWLWDPTWPELVHPHASAIDTPLPIWPSCLGAPPSPRPSASATARLGPLRVGRPSASPPDTQANATPRITERIMMF